MGTAEITYSPATIYIVIAIVVFMFYGMISSRFEFGVSPVLAVILLILTGCGTFEEALVGFTNKYVIMTLCMLILNKALERTSLMAKFQSWVIRVSKGKNGMFIYYLMLLAAIIVPILPGSGFYILLLLMLNMPKNDKVSPAQMLLPVSCTSWMVGGHMPSAGMFMGISMLNGMLQGLGEITVGKMILTGILVGIPVLIYMLFAWKVLPDREIGYTEENEKESKKKEPLSRGQEISTYIALILSTLALILSDLLGDIAYILPAVGIVMLVLSKTITYNDCLKTAGSRLIIMMACIFGVVNVMQLRGVTDLFGTGIENILGNNAPALAVLAVFALTAFLMMNLTGALFGTLFLIVPMGVAYCSKIGLNPAAIAVAVQYSLIAILLPTDTQINLVFSTGKYKLNESLKFTLPLALIYEAAVILVTYFVFPM